MIIDVPDAFTPHTTPVVVLAHGAAEGMRSSFMEDHATEFCARGLGVVRFQFPYMERSSGARRPPDAMETLLDAYQEVLIAQGKRTGSPPGPLFVGGKSLGARVATVLCAQGKVKPSGMILLGYPLHPAKKGHPAKSTTEAQTDMRADHLRRCRTPLLFVQGERDPLCDLDLLRGVRKSNGLAGSLHVVPGGDHSFAVASAGRARQQAELARVADVVAAFVKKALQRR